MHTFRKALPYLLIALTIAVFIYFFVKNPKLRHALAATSPWVILLVALLYGLFIICLAWVYSVTLQLCGKRLPLGENLLLTCYSTIANFFGPLQSGPGVRAAYLKQKHQVKLRDYSLASLVYYALYATVSAVFLLIGSGRYWLLGLAATVAVAGGSLGIVLVMRRRFANREGQPAMQLKPAIVMQLLLATICQLSIVALIYYVELRAVHTGASLRQAITYGGAANFALFVSLTPGAIGFREAFLAFSRRLHHISTAGILAANLIDRAVFVAFLGVLFLLVLATHATKRFTSHGSTSEDN